MTSSEISPLKKALQSGAAGFGAMSVQVTALMWLRTTVNYQYRHGGTGRAALRRMYREGGVRRLYSGYAAAMLQAPLARFGDVASYTAVQQRLGDSCPVWQSTGLASLASASWRLGLMPLDSLKTSMQVHGGRAGLGVLRDKVRRSGPGVLFHGYLGTAGANMLGYYPWFFTFGWLDRQLPVPGEDAGVLAPLARHATMGLAASAASDTASNAARVLKTYRQTAPAPVGYAEAAQAIVRSEGWRGLLGRGLGTKLVSNGIQSATFAVAWKYFEKLFRQRDAAAAEQQ